MSMSTLEQRLKRVEDQLEKLQDPQEIIFETYWGDEEIPDDGNPTFVTEWGGGAIDESKETTRDKYYEGRSEE